MNVSRIPEHAEELSNAFKDGKQQILAFMKASNLPVITDTNEYLDVRQQEMAQIVEVHFYYE
jgi:hypothetical protein